MRVRHTLIYALASLIGSAAVSAQTPDSTTSPTPAQTPAPTPEQTPAPTPAPTPEQRIAAIKQNLAQSQQNLKQYQWVEITAVSYKGEEKSSTTHSCAYDADGKVVKTLLSTPAAETKEKGGLRGKVAENKKEEMTAYMQSAAALIKSYVPLDPAKLQACKEAGKMTMSTTDPGKKGKLEFKDYQKPGDNVGVEIDLTTNQIIGLSVASYLADVKDAVNLNVVMATLPDGTGYPSTIKISAPAKEMVVAVTNSTHQKKAN